ncbi:spore germination protein [Paenisporosarcina macmurdoensis]|uniref:Spore germination protein n=1 Tax=Paenisporosarcina macmurdoensis TaxID=212659 RepID=A0ABW1L7M2_9BACL
MKFFKRQPSKKSEPSGSFDLSALSNRPILPSLQENVDMVLKTFYHTDDLKQKNMTIQRQNGSLLFLESLTDMEKVQKGITHLSSLDPEGNGDSIYQKIGLRSETELQPIVEKLLKGYSILLLDGTSEAIILDTNIQYNRSPEEPTNEKVVRGSHEGFVENLVVNMNLIRKRIESPNLIVKQFTVGNITRTSVSVVYMQGIADEVIVKEVEKRIQAINSDLIFSLGFVEEFLETSVTSPFPQMLNTERPDRVIANILEGRIAILGDGSPTALILPINFFAFYQSPDDYNSRSIAGSFYRMLRMFSFSIAVLLPATYIAIVSFHFEVIPGNLILPVKGSLENIPYQPLVEALLMELIIELIREAGIRLPTPIGQTIGIVGGLVIGESVVRAGLVSNLMVIVVALTAISSFVIPSTEMNTSVRILRFPFMIAAASFGFFGIVFCIMILLIHLCKLESFGRAYFAPLAPFNWKDMRDMLVRLPIWMQDERPKDASPQKTKRGGMSRPWKQEK